MAIKTPPHGYPFPHSAAIESLREDLRVHSQNDERELSTIREDVKELLQQTSGQTEILNSLKLARQDETAIVKQRRKRINQYRGTVLTVIGALIGAAIHHFL